MLGKFPFLAILLALALPGCTAISALQDASEPLAIYELATPAARPAAGPRRGAELVVAEPMASGALATDRIMIRPQPLQVEYLPGARWADPAPEMLQTMILRHLSETGAFGSVARRPVGTTGDYAVLTELTDFQAETGADMAGATVRLRLVARLVDDRDARVIAARTFSVTRDAASTEVGAVVAAFDAAGAVLLGDLARWLLAEIG
ncbi:ABC-type transport auxiliary lipoprotein family protein [Rhodovulum sp. YNF3179]|uniref:ABC-type transport auxiliary lipoprotein family protein n=1 Tax=Rhodovulum sp. YNF3179 TaxID=3425127 RepID=UPI003D3565A5